MAPGRQGFAQTPVVRLIVPTAVQGSTDTIARLLADGWTRRGIRGVVVENVVGRNGTQAAQQVAASAPDGLTLLIATQNSHAIAPAFLAGVAYDPVRSFTPIIRFAAAPYVLVVKGSGPASIGEFARQARAAQGGWRYASTGVLGPHHLIALQYFRAAGLALRHVPLAGGAVAIEQVVSGEVDVMLPAAVLALPKIRSGQLRALAVSSGSRASALPDVPTLRESGTPLVNQSWYGLMAPAGLAATKVQGLIDAVLAVLEDPLVRKAFLDLAIDSRSDTGSAFQDAIAAELAGWKQLAATINLPHTPEEKSK